MKKIKKNGFDVTLSKAKTIIKSPIVTEKTTLIAGLNQFVFIVDKKSNAKEIKIAIEKLFKVKVLKVNTINIKGKAKLFKNVIGKRADKKKAIITISQDKVLDVSSGI